MSQSSENCPDSDTGSSIQEGEPIAPKIGKLNDPFEYAPKKPDGDHWENLLRPLFEEDKAQCNIWKDEVSNLLIFAGLFSAVVTAFIIESYMSLQRDPNQDMIVLLSQIVDRLGNNTSAASSQPSGPLPTFSPTRPSIRINIFWFISLILSLTTVLVGIISLQWLREYQNYVNLTPRQQYAIFHMRKEGFEKWHVGKIFTAMPLLLQSALVLFLTGIIDFLLSFGDIAVVIPVTVVIGLTLLFLIATTLFPTLQGFYLFIKVFFSGGPRNIPVQCPYKSPQSNAVRAVSLPIFTVLHLLNRIILNTGAGYLAEKDILARKTYDDWVKRNGTFINTIYYSDRTWLAFDLQWLAIRDGFMCHAFNRPLQVYERLGHSGRFTLIPIWDILQGLVSQTRPDISSPYYAYMEVSDMTLSSSANPNGYLHDVVAYGGWNSGSDICFHDFYEDISHSDVDYRSLAKYQALYGFLCRIARHTSPDWVVEWHKSEIYLRLMEYLFTQNIPIRPKNGQDVLPDCLVANSYSFNTAALQAMVLQLFTTLFTQLNTESTPTSPVIAFITSFVADSRSCNSFDLIKADHQGQHAIASLFDLMNKSLIQEICSVIVPGSGTARATLPFYTSAIFANQFITACTVHVWQPSLETLLSTIRQYKDLTIDKGMSDSEIELQLGHIPAIIWSNFSANWWSNLLEDVPPLDSSIINDISHNNAQPSPPDTSLRENFILTPAESEPHVSITMDDSGPTDIIPG